MNVRPGGENDLKSPPHRVNGRGHDTERIFSMQTQTTCEPDGSPKRAYEVISGVYFIQTDDEPDGLIKIGYSEDVHARLRNHQCGAPRRLKILGVIPNVNQEIEARLHRRFSESRVRGEWFEPTDLLRRLIDGDANFLIALVTAGEAGHLLRVKNSVADEELDSYGAAAGPKGGWRYFLEDVDLIAARVEEERVRRATRDAVELVRKRVFQAIKDVVSPESVAECVEQAWKDAA